MQKPNKEKASLREGIQYYFHAVKLLYLHMPQVIIARICAASWKALTPYIGIFLSACIINELAGSCDPEKLQFFILLSLGTAAVIALVNAALTKWKETVCAADFYKQRQIRTKKLFSMDFVTIDDTKTQELLQTLHQFEQGGGWGLVRVNWTFDVFIDAVASFVGGIVLTITLFTHSVPEDAGTFVILNHPLFLFGILGAMLGVTYLAPLLKTKADSYYYRLSNSQALTNMQFGFYMGTLQNKKYAADIRIYRQDRIANCVMGDDAHPFGNKGLYAKYSKGPIGLYQAAGSAVSVVFTGIAYAFVCLKAWAGAFGVGEITQYVAAITKLASSVSTIIEQFGFMRNNAPFLKTEFKFLDIPNAMYQGSLTVEKRRDRQYEIEFRNVSFKYPGAENYALRNVSMKFRVGQRLAVVGMNGSGKTTFIKLLCRLYDPTEGEILLNGIDIRKYNYLEYLSVFSVVFQDFKLFSFKLGENVAGSTSYDEDRVRDCLIKAGFGDRLMELPNGLDTYLYKDFDKEGVDISGGEAQKIALARTLYKDAPFIILDEPTAALDPIAEAEVYSKFNEIVGDKTAIYISHRLSSCRFCDEIVVFDHGAVIQQGSHDALVADENGKYHELWYAQAQYYV